MASYIDTDGGVSVGNGGYGNGFMNGDSPFWAIILLAIILPRL